MFKKALSLTVLSSSAAQATLQAVAGHSSSLLLLLQLLVGSAPESVGRLVFPLIGRPEVQVVGVDQEQLDEQQRQARKAQKQAQRLLAKQAQQREKKRSKEKRKNYKCQQPFPKKGKRSR